MKVRGAMVQAGLIVVLISSISITLLAVPADTPSLGAQRWAKALGAAGRAPYLQDAALRGLPVEYRHALLATIPRGEERAAFWKTAFETYGQQRSLTPDQATALSWAAGSITPEAVNGSLRSIELWQAITASLQPAFDRAAIDDLLYNSRAVSATAVGLPRPESAAYHWRRVRDFASTGLRLTRKEVTCNCNTTAQCGSGNWDCQSVSCSGTGTDCGGSPCGFYCVPVGRQ